MGTNYYWMNGFIEDPRQFGQFIDEAEIEMRDDPRVHIGKRSAAGRWCWDCGVSLAREGTREVHYRSTWHDACPACGKTWDESIPITRGTGGMELGFVKAADVPKVGVSSCSSFTWTMMEHKRRATAYSRAQDFEDKKVIRNEYGAEFTAAEFLECLSAVTIEDQYFGEFS